MRPMLVLTQPPIKPPMMQPMSALETTKPSSESGGVGLRGVGQVGKARIDEVGLEAIHRAVDDGGVVTKKQSAQGGDEGEQDNVGIQARHNFLSQIDFAKCTTAWLRPDAAGNEDVRRVHRQQQSAPEEQPAAEDDTGKNYQHRQGCE